MSLSVNLPMRLQRAAFVVVSLFLFSSCGFKVPPPPQLKAHKELSAADSKVLLEELGVYTNRVRSFRGSFEVLLESVYGEEKLTQVLAFQRPQRLRLEFFATNLNALTALLITNGSSLHAVDPINNVVYRGQAKEEIIERLLSIPVSPEGLMLWSVARLKVPGENKAEDLELLRKGEEYALKYRESSKKDVLAVFRRRSEEYADLELLRFEVRKPDGERIFISDFEYSSDTEDNKGEKVRVPSEIVFWLPGKKLKGTLKSEKSKPNSEFGPRDERLFLGRTPAGAKIYYLEDGENSSGLKSLF